MRTWTRRSTSSTATTRSRAPTTAGSSTARTSTAWSGCSAAARSLRRRRRPTPDERYIAPTVLVDVSPDSPIMQEEVFGPILPVLEIDSVEAVIEWVNEPAAPARALRLRRGRGGGRAHPRARPSRATPAINDCAIHPLVPELPFGGVGNSGMGKYHGQLGLRGVHQRARRPLSQRHGSTPACATRRTRSTLLRASSKAD